MYLLIWVIIMSYESCRPDQSRYLAHFTKCSSRESKRSAKDVFKKILSEKMIEAHTVPWTKGPAVCFTECPWASMTDHAKKYSSYGIGFTKEYIYRRGGNPVFYVRPEIYSKQEWDDSIINYFTPFVPKYALETTKAEIKRNGFGHDYLDYSHEREWRLLKNLDFDYADISFLVVDKAEEIEEIVEVTQGCISTDLILPMSTYKMIESLWPVHKINITL